MISVITLNISELKFPIKRWRLDWIKYIMLSTINIPWLYRCRQTEGESMKKKTPCNHEIRKIQEC
jgi:hypothetical protein